MDLPPVRRLAATFLGSGLSPVMPGTCGSVLAALPCFILPDAAYPWTLAAGVLAATLGCVVLSRQLGTAQDPPWFVLDEAAGLWLAAAWPTRPGHLHVLLALVLFRVFDIWKPWPIRALERAGGGWGIVLDDLMAGAYALVLTLAAHSLLP